MQYYHNIDGRETYVGRHIEIKPDATSFIDGIRYLDIDYGIWYIVANKQWIIDKSEYDGTVYNSKGELVNIADAYYDETITIEDIETRYFRKGYVYGSGYTWSNVTSNTTVNLYIKIGAKPIYMSYVVAGVALADYGLVNGATITTNGTLNTIIKRNNSVIVQPVALIYRDATYTGGATAIPRFLGSSGNAQQRTGGSDISQKAILQANSNYIITLKNSNTSTQERMGIYIDWLELEI